MCIRDSITHVDMYTLSHYGACGPVLAAASILRPVGSREQRHKYDSPQAACYGVLFAIQSVSYTHLDVYKRQVHWSTGPTTKGGAVLIDCHVHVKGGDKYKREFRAKQILQCMDEAGIDRSVIFSICLPSRESNALTME